MNGLLGPSVSFTTLALLLRDNSCPGLHFQEVQISELKIKAGTQVIWTNDSDAIHTVTSDTLIFNTNNLATNQVFSVIFTRPGTYPYYCNIHTYMLGTIIVTP